MQRVKSHLSSWSRGIAEFGGADEAGAAGIGAAGWLWVGIGNPRGIWGLQSLACPSGWHGPPLELSPGFGWRHFSGTFLCVGALENLPRFLESSSDHCCVHPWAPHTITEHPTQILCASGMPGMGSSIPVLRLLCLTQIFYVRIPIVSLCLGWTLNRFCSQYSKIFLHYLKIFLLFISIIYLNILLFINAITVFGSVCCCLCSGVTRLPQEMCAQVFAAGLGPSENLRKCSENHPKQEINFIYPYSLSFPGLLSDVFSVPACRSEPEAAEPMECRGQSLSQPKDRCPWWLRLRTGWAQLLPLLAEILLSALLLSFLTYTPWSSCG